jgi:4-alpha-glucanotransferase
MNTPGQSATNWSWRISSGALSSERAARLRRLAVLTGRAEPAP